MAITLNKERFMKIFWLLFFLLFFYFHLEKFDFFSIVASETEGRSVPLIFLLYPYFKILLIKNPRIVPLIVSIFLLLVAVLLLFVLSFFIAKILERTNLSSFKIFKRIEDIAKKILNVKVAYILSFLFLLSFSIRLLYLNAGLFHHDSVETALATEKTLETGKLHGIVGYRYGFVLLNAIAYIIPHFIFGVQTAEVTVNVVTVLFASLSIIVMYLFVKELLENRYIAIYSSLMLAFTPIYMSVTTYSKDHSLSILLILLAGYSLIKSLKENLTLHKVLFGCFLGYSLFVRVSDTFTILLPFLILYTFPNKFLNEADIKFKKRFSFKELMPILIPLLFALALFLVFQGDSISGGLGGNKFLENKGNYYNLILSIMITFTPLGVFLAAYGLFITTKRKPYLALLLFIWFMVVLLFYSTFITSKLRFYIPLLIPLFIVMGIALEYLKEDFSVLTYIALAALLISMFMFIQPILEYRHHYSSGKELALYIANHTEPDSVIMDAGDHGMFYNYYAKRKFIQCPNDYNPKQFDDTLREIDDALQRNIPVYFNSRCFDLPSDFELKQIVNKLSNNYVFIPIGNVEIENYEYITQFYKYGYTIYKVTKLQKTDISN